MPAHLEGRAGGEGWGQLQEVGTDHWGTPQSQHRTPHSASCPSPGCTTTSSKMEPGYEGLRQDPRQGRWQQGPCPTGCTTAPKTCSVPTGSQPCSTTTPFPCAQPGAPGLSSKDGASVPAVLYCSCLPALTSPVSAGFMLHINILPEPPVPQRALLMTPDPSEQRGVTAPQPPTALQTQIWGISTQK